MSYKKIAFLHALSAEVYDEIVRHTPDGFETVGVHRSESEDERVRVVGEAGFIIAFGAELSDRVLQAATNVRLVQLLSAGYDSMNLALMGELGIPCANNGGANSWAVSDHALLLMLALYRRLLNVNASAREGRWDAPLDGTNTFELADKLVGVLGMGRIGRQVAKRVQAFDARVQYNDKYRLTPEQEDELGVSYVGLDGLFQTSDIVTCHTPLTFETRRLVSRERLASMKPTAVLINTSRGEVVDEAALIEALGEGRIAGAGLDVFEREPIDPANPLLKMANVVVTPHSAGTAWDTWARRAEFAYGNIQRVSEGKPPLSVVSHECE